MNKMLKIFAVIYVILCIIICVNILIFHVPQSTMSIKNIKIENCVHSLSAYNIDVSKVENPKMVTITCEIKNKSFFKKIYNIKPRFVNFCDIEILPSDKIDNSEVYLLTLKPRESRIHRYNFIIDAKEYNEEELLGLLNNIKLTLTGQRYTLTNIKKGYLLDKESQTISTQEFNCQVIQY